MILPEMSDADKAKHWLEVMVEIADDAKDVLDHMGSGMIGNYHDALGELAQVCDENVSIYRIPMGRLEPVGRTKDVQCDADYFRSQIAGLLKRFKVQPV